MLDELILKYIWKNKQGGTVKRILKNKHKWASPVNIKHTIKALQLEACKAHDYLDQRNRIKFKKTMYAMDIYYMINILS